MRGDLRVTFRQMVWTQRNGRWCGSWIWTNSHDHYFSLPQLLVDRVEERAIRAWNTADAPQEIFMRIIECHVQVQPRQRARLPQERGLKLRNLALVCRAWYTTVSPVLRERLEIGDEVLSFPLRKSVAQHARELAVRSYQPMAISARIAQSSPRPSPAVALAWMSPNEEGQRAPYRNPKPSLPVKPYHPSHVVVFTQLHRSYSGVTFLNLSRCTFFSSSDLLRILTSMSALEEVFLRGVVVAHVSDTVIQRGRPFTSPIKSIYADDKCSPSGLPFVSRCWTWPCNLSSYQELLQNGLFEDEARRQSRSGDSPGGSYYVDRIGATCE